MRSRRPEEMGPRPEDTTRVARAAFPKGTPAPALAPALALHDLLGPLYEAAQCAALVAVNSRPQRPGAWRWSP